jgi:hypothetical protein
MVARRPNGSIQFYELRRGVSIVAAQSFQDESLR